MKRLYALVMILVLALAPMYAQTTNHHDKTETAKCDSKKDTPAVGEWEVLNDGHSAYNGNIVFTSSLSYGDYDTFMEDYTLTDIGFVCGKVYSITYATGIRRFTALVATIKDDSMWRTKKAAEEYVETACKSVFYPDPITDRNDNNNYLRAIPTLVTPSWAVPTFGVATSHN